MNVTVTRASVGEALPPIHLGALKLDWSRTYLMGVVNVTPDSFSDGGRFFDVEAAVAHGLALAEQGADVLDVGGESTRPGAAPVSAAEEKERVLPVIQGLRAGTDRPISIDTYKAEVAAAACAQGATLVNDITGLTLDPELAAVTAEAGAALVVGHIRGTPETMQQDVAYADLLREVGDGLEAALQRAVSAGVPRDRVLVDPGIGFGKGARGNLTLIRGGGALRERLGRPLLVGASRKSFIGKITGAEVGDRVPGTLAAHALARVYGADMIRVHDMAAAVQAARIVDGILAAEPGGGA